MSMRNRSGRFVPFGMVITLVLAACGSQPDQATPTAEPPSATSTATLPPALSPTHNPTDTPPPPTPDFLASPIVNSFLFSPNDNPNCQLPCWQGLRVDVSIQDDVQKVFAQVFGFNDTFNFFDDPMRLRPLIDFDVPGMRPGGVDWYSPNDGLFGAYALVDVEDSILQGLAFAYAPSGGGAFEVRTSQQIIRELGTPSYIDAEVDLPPSSDTALIRFNILYQQGMAFHSAYNIPVQQQEVNGVSTATGEFCLNMPISTGADFILAPFDDLNNLSLIQERWLASLMGPTPHTSARKVFGFTIEEITSVALREQNPCITIKSE